MDSFTNNIGLPFYGLCSTLGRGLLLATSAEINKTLSLCGMGRGTYRIRSNRCNETAIRAKSVDMTSEEAEMFDRNAWNIDKSYWNIKNIGKIYRDCFEEDVEDCYNPKGLISRPGTRKNAHSSTHSNNISVSPVKNPPTDRKHDGVISTRTESNKNGGLCVVNGGDKAASTRQNNVVSPSNCNTGRCFNCGVKGHGFRDCLVPYESYDDSGRMCYVCKNGRHRVKYCRLARDISSTFYRQRKNLKNGVIDKHCLLCGRYGHLLAECLQLGDFLDDINKFRTDKNTNRKQNETIEVVKLEQKVVNRDKMSEIENNHSIFNPGAPLKLKEKKIFQERGQKLRSRCDNERERCQENLNCRRVEKVSDDKKLVKQDSKSEITTNFNSKQNGANNKNKPNKRCFNCDKEGHLIRMCPKPIRNIHVMKDKEIKIKEVLDQPKEEQDDKLKLCTLNVDDFLQISWPGGKLCQAMTKKGSNHISFKISLGGSTSITKN